MTGRISPELRDVLVYLDEIGYGEIYLPATTSAIEADRPRPAPAAEASSARLPAAPSGPPARSVAAGPAPEPPPPAAPLETAPVESTAPAASATPAEPPADDPAARAAALAAVAQEASGCEKCKLWRGRTNVVFGVGDPNADLMFIGEGPGADEDRKGEPFVGAAGQLLNKIISAIGLSREQVYIANVVKCRPPGNRDPQPDEANACRSYLDRQIDLVRPKVIVALGRVAAQALLGNDLPLGRMRGEWTSVRGVPTMVTYHPAALLRNQAWKRPTWEDMQQVRDRLAGS